VPATLTIEIQGPDDGTPPPPGGTAGGAPPAPPAPFTPPLPRPPHDPFSGKAPDSSRVSAFDRPIAVIIMGPKPLPVIWAQPPHLPESGGGGSRIPSPPKAKGGSTFRNLAQVAQIGVQATGQFTANTARNANLAGSVAAAEGFTAALGRAGPYALAFAATLQIGTTAAKAFSETVNNFVQRGRELAAYNGGLASATARADIRSLQSDFREADVLGSKLERLIDNQSKSEAVFRELMLPIKEWLLDRLNGIIEGALRLLVELLETARDGVNKLGGMPATLARIDDTLKRIKDILDGKLGGGDFIKTWLDDLGKFVPPPAAKPFPLGVPVPFPGVK